MATYKKNNFRPNRNKKSDDVSKVEDLEQIPQNVEQESTTAEVFNTLDEGAYKTEKWVEENQKPILGVIAAVLLIGLGYMLYQQFVSKPNSLQASNEISYPLQTFENALNATDTKVRDSLFNASLKGTNGRYGFLDIIQKYKGTDAANIAYYSAGMAYLHTNKYKEAIENLDKFSSSDNTLSVLTLGNIGDAFVQIKQNKDALDYYEKAFKKGDSYTAPIYLNKAAFVCIELKEYKKALDFFEKIRKEYPKSEEARNAEIQIARTQTLLEN